MHELGLPEKEACFQIYIMKPPVARVPIHETTTALPTRCGNHV